MRAITVLLLLPTLVFGQEAPSAPASGLPTPRPLDSAFFRNVPPRELGPTAMSGRIMDLAVYEAKPRIYYVASASGGLWKTENAGLTFRPVFDREATVSLGACAVDQNDPNRVWVGTGEGSSRNSVGWGDGVYLSTDGGSTWTNMGLRDTKHITRIVLHPRNPNIVYVGALGHLWGENEERGLFKSEDGGKTWKKILYVDERTGVADLVMNPKNPNELLCAMWERRRRPWQFASGGPGSGLYKTTDGGKTWRKITRGLPETTLGRIGLDYFRKDPRIVVATVEYAREDARPGVVRQDGGGTFRSTDGGETWTEVNRLNPRPFYFSTIRQDPNDVDRIYVLGVSLHVSDNQGKDFRTIAPRIHPDFHVMWIDPNDSEHIIVGNDGGLAESRDRGLTWKHFLNLPLAQYYAIGFDMRKPYWVYGGMQDNGSWATPTQVDYVGVRPGDSAKVGGGDGFYVQVDPEDWRIVYNESQGGALRRFDQVRGTSVSIRPRAPQGERYRFNWSSPILISPHNPRTIYFGGNKLFRSVDRGDNWEVISPDLTTNDRRKIENVRAGVTPEDTGAERHCTITTISESPLRYGVLWVGTDDGNLQVSQDGGATWTNVVGNIPDLPRNTWCSRVVASRFALGRAYATFDGHRENDYRPYVYVTEDFGQTWRKLHEGLPEGESCYVIREGTRNPDLLLLGTEMSLWISLDRGQNWTRYTTGTYPTVAVHDIAIHPRDLDIILGTHGRGAWIIPAAGLEGLTAEAMNQPAAVFEPAPAYLLGFVRQPEFAGDGEWFSRNSQPGARIFYWLAEAASEDPIIEIAAPDGAVLATLTGSRDKGLNRVDWNLRTGSARRFVEEGVYRVTLKVGGQDYVTRLKVEDLSESMSR